MRCVPPRVGKALFRAKGVPTCAAFRCPLLFLLYSLYQARPVRRVMGHSRIMPNECMEVVVVVRELGGLIVAHYS